MKISGERFINCCYAAMGMKPQTVRKELMDVLACPADKGQLVLDKTKALLKCRKCGKTYEVKEGIPVFV